MSSPRLKQLRKWVEQGKVTITVESETYRATAVHPFGKRAKWKFIGWDWSFSTHGKLGTKLRSVRDEEKQAWVETLIIDPKHLNTDQITSLESLVRQETQGPSSTAI